MPRIVAFVLAVALALTGGGCSGCATALLEGTLVADGSGGLAVQAPEGAIVRVRWPGGVGIGHDGDRLVLTNWLGQATAHEGEFVSMGGGQALDSDGFAACGPVSVSASGPPTR